MKHLILNYWHQSSSPIWSYIQRSCFVSCFMKWLIILYSSFFFILNFYYCSCYLLMISQIINLILTCLWSSCLAPSALLFSFSFSVVRMEIFSADSSFTYYKKLFSKYDLVLFFLYLIYQNLKFKSLQWLWALYKDYNHIILSCGRIHTA